MMYECLSKGTQGREGCSHALLLEKAGPQVQVPLESRNKWDGIVIDIPLPNFENNVGPW